LRESYVRRKALRFGRSSKLRPSALFSALLAFGWIDSIRWHNLVGRKSEAPSAAADWTGLKLLEQSYGGRRFAFPPYLLRPSALFSALLASFESISPSERFLAE